MVQQGKEQMQEGEDCTKREVEAKEGNELAHVGGIYVDNKEPLSCIVLSHILTPYWVHPV